MGRHHSRRRDPRGDRRIGIGWRRVSTYSERPTGGPRVAWCRRRWGWSIDASTNSRSVAGHDEYTGSNEETVGHPETHGEAEAQGQPDADAYADVDVDEAVGQAELPHRICLAKQHGNGVDQNVTEGAMLHRRGVQVRSIDRGWARRQDG